MLETKTYTKTIEYNSFTFFRRCPLLVRGSMIATFLLLRAAGVPIILNACLSLAVHFLPWLVIKEEWVTALEDNERFVRVFRWALLILYVFAIYDIYVSTWEI